MYGEVLSVERPTPHLVRVVLGGDGLASFTPVACSDSYVNVAIPPADAPYAAPFDLDDLKALPNEQRPYRRRITVRRWDAERRELTLDFVTHGDVGFAGPWAARAQPGDALVLTGPAGAYNPDPSADWLLMVGDESALPAIAASLEAVPAGRPAFAVLVADGPEHELVLESPGDLQTTWLHRDGSGADERLLADAVAGLALPAGRGEAFVHGEAGETRAVRRHLLEERGMAADALSCSPYWRRGMTDEEWRRVKAAFNAETEREVPSVPSA